MEGLLAELMSAWDGQAATEEGLAAADEPAGLGLGFFIAKTLLERSGATLTFENRAAPERGAVVRVRWRRADFERPLTFAAAPAWYPRMPATGQI